ncbi:4075_t:CDS:1, partial [Acaulospora colombiana]
VQIALQNLTSHLPEWQTHHEKVTTEYEDLSRTLSHMNIDCTKKEERLENLTEEATLLRSTLHSPRAQPGEAVHTGYRRDRLEETEKDKQALADRLSQLRNEVEVTQVKVDNLAKQAGSAASVMRYCDSGVTALQKIEGCLDEEIKGLQHRLGRRIDLLDDKDLASIFYYTWSMQVEESERQFLLGDATQVSRSPFGTTYALASVNKRWRAIMESEEQQSLWRFWIAELDPNHIFRLIISVKPGSNVRKMVRDYPISLRLLSTPNTVASFFHARVKLELFLNSQPVKCFQIRCNQGFEESTSNLVNTISTRGHLESLAVVGEAGVQMSKLILSESTISDLKELILVDIEAQFPSSNTPSQLRSLRLTRNKRPMSTAMSSREIIAIISITPFLETLEVDIGMEDTPQFVPSNFSLGGTSLCHLRHIKLRFTLLQNRLSFLASLEMPALCKLTLITMPAQAPDTSWTDMIQFLSSNNNFHRITHLTIKELTEKLR